MSDFWHDRQTGKTARLADYVLRTPHAVLVVPNAGLARYVRNMRPDFYNHPTKLVTVEGLLTWRQLVSEESGRTGLRPPTITELIVDDVPLLSHRDMRDVQLFAHGLGATVRYRVSAKEAGHGEQETTTQDQGAAGGEGPDSGPSRGR